MRRWAEMIAARQPIRRVVLDVGMHALAATADWLPQMRRRRARCELIADIDYVRRADSALQLDIVRPAAEGTHPVVLYFHGGAFAIGSKRTHRAVAVAYAAQGYLVCNVDYRLAPEHPFPAAVEDACAAWLWTVDHVSRYGGDPQRIAVAGESAGANLALVVAIACCIRRPEPYAAALFDRGMRPAAALLYSGFLQVSEPQRYRRAGVSALAARIARDAAQSYLGESAGTPGTELADPLRVIESMAADSTLPPIFIAAGGADPVRPDSERLEDALRQQHATHLARYYPGETHAFHMMFWRIQALQCWRESFDFLQRFVSPQPSPID
jgi:acetyl esterase